MLIARMAGLTSGAAGSVYKLSGTSGSPNSAVDVKTTPTDTTVSWIFNTDGTVDKKEAASTSQFQTGVEWDSDQPTPCVDNWLRATVDVGDTPSVGTIGSWSKVAGAGSSIQTYTWAETTNGAADQTGTLKIEIATDSGGTNIVATGYYRGTAQVLSGA